MMNDDRGQRIRSSFCMRSSRRRPIDSAQALRATSNGIFCLAFAAIRRRSWCEQSPAVDHPGSFISLANQSAPQCFSTDEVRVRASVAKKYRSPFRPVHTGCRQRYRVVLRENSGGVRMIRPQSVGLHVTHDKRCSGRHIFNAVRELFHDVGHCLRVRGAMTWIAEV